MNGWLKISLTPLLGCLAWVSALGAPSPGSELGAALQAIQQAPDPSAAVAAYANGVAIDHNDPILTQAYVARMVELGLPELAYHQAQALTTRDSNNGLAWGVVAYVDARRGQMPEAVSAINLAGQLAPENAFVQKTAGEILAWYDAKADKSQLPANAKEGLSRVRSLMQGRAGFSPAYDTAKKAYVSQGSAAEPGAAVAPADTNWGPATVQGQAPGEQIAPLGYAAPTGSGAPPVYAYPDSVYPGYVYPDYYNYYADWGPGWVSPAPWWWWQPAGFFAGFSFCPFGAVVVFDNDDFHHHHHHDGDRHSGHQGHDAHFASGQGSGHSFHHGDPAVWHHDATGRSSFFGQPATPTASIARWTKESFKTAQMTRVTTSGSSLGMSRTPSAAFRSSGVVGSGSRLSGNSSVGQAPSTTRGSWMAAPSFRTPPASGAGAWRGASAPTLNSWSGRPSSGWTGVAPRSSWSGDNFRSAPSFAGPRMGAPMGGAGSPGGVIQGGGMGGGGFHGGGGFSGGGHGGGGGHR